MVAAEIATRTYTPEVSDQGPDPLGSEAPPAAEEPASEPGPLPEFLNPESVHYQPWAEKQISNASKEKRPLADFMAEMEERLGSYGELPEARWDPQRQEQLLARFAPSSPGRTRRRHRRRGGSGAAHEPTLTPAAPIASAAPGNQRRRPKPARAPAAGPAQPTAEPGAHRRRRRRRRSRGESAGPTVAGG